MIQVSLSATSCCPPEYISKKPPDVTYAYLSISKTGSIGSILHFRQLFCRIWQASVILMFSPTR